MFTDRREAGRLLGRRLLSLNRADSVVLALPRGGVPVGFEVARALGAPLDVVVVRKLGVPYQPELAMGAIGEDGVRVLNAEVLAVSAVDEEEFAAVERRERAELDRRAERYRLGRAREDLEGKTAIVVDDGVATGATARAACRVARARGASEVILAAPVCGPDTAERLGGDVDGIVCLEVPGRFCSVGQSYESFRQTSDDEVVDLLRRAETRADGGG
jgi:putative phosphoribosyl transferase